MPSRRFYVPYGEVFLGSREAFSRGAENVVGLIDMLLCDFHIHTTYSDGILPMRKVVDLFGQSGHDVIAITDHIVNRDNPLGRIAHAIKHSLNPETWKRYFEEIRMEAER